MNIYKGALISQIICMTLLFLPALRRKPATLTDVIAFKLGKREERDVSILKAADRDDVHAVLPTVGVIPDASQHHLE